MRIKTPKRLTASIKKDGVHPADYNRLKLPWACEDCVYFDHEKETCTLGYNSDHHRRDEQLKSYFLSGKMALCRFQELD
jgi:hypothetical protein